GAYVLTVGTDDTVVEKRVQTEGASGVDWIVPSGLEPGDRIIVAGIQSAHPGAKVVASEEPAAPAKSRSAATGGVMPAAGARRVAAADPNR
ncbi:MAG: efflux RND transporter periplasmic adaptor subunit, partial [Steroidobacteraceae bacterium]